MSDDDEDVAEQRAAEHRDAQLLETLDREAEVKRLTELLQNEHMRDFLWRVLTKCRVFGSVYSRNFGDMSLAEGMRNVGNWIMTEIAEADPNALLAMQLKANLRTQRAAADDRRKNAQRARRSATTP